MKGKKSGLIVMKHLITMSTDYLKRRGDKVTVAECFQELGHLRSECEKLIKEYEK